MYSIESGPVSTDSGADRLVRCALEVVRLWELNFFIGKLSSLSAFHRRVIQYRGSDDLDSVTDG